jgi:hypothetical protein
VNAKLTCADCAPMYARTSLRGASQVCPTLEAKPEATEALLHRQRNPNWAKDHRLAGCARVRKTRWPRRSRPAIRPQAIDTGATQIVSSEHQTAVVKVEDAQDRTKE